MLKGAHAVKHADGFPEAERPASVPEDAMLEADLELLSWRSVEDVTPDGGVVKKVRRSKVARVKNAPLRAPQPAQCSW